MYAPRGIMGFGAAGDTVICPPGTTDDGTGACINPWGAPAITDVNSCYNTSTNAYGPCPVAGVSQSSTPAGVGPFGAPSSMFASLQAWLAANSWALWVAGGLAAVAVLGGGGRGRR